MKKLFANIGFFFAWLWQSIIYFYYKDYLHFAKVFKIKKVPLTIVLGWLAKDAFGIFCLEIFNRDTNRIIVFNIKIFKFRFYIDVTKRRKAK